MTFEELYLIFQRAREGTRRWTGTEWVGDYGGDRGGLTAAVKALRDEICAFIDSEEGAYEWFNEILGIAAGEKVDTRKAYWDKHYGVDQPETPAAAKNWTFEDTCRAVAALSDPAPAERSDATAVCAWQRAGFNWDKRWPQCDPTSGPMFVTYRASIPQKCPLCFRPIKFTEAK